MMARTRFCMQLTRTVLAFSIVLFILLSITTLFNIPYIPSPDYSPVVLVLLDLVLVVGLISAATQHLKTLIVFGWLMALTVLLIFFGNTVSSQYQSDFWGMLYMLYITVIAFTDAVCIIKYRMPKEQMAFACHQQHLHHQLQQQQQQQLQQSSHQFQQQVFEVPPPPPVNQYYASKSDPQFHAV